MVEGGENLMGVKDPDVFMALAELSDELTARRLAILDGLFAVTVEAEGYPAATIELSGTDLESVRSVLLRAIDREQAEVDARLKEQGVQFGGTITVSADGEVTMPEDGANVEPPQPGLAPLK
jgi:hypothetical protein